MSDAAQTLGSPGRFSLPVWQRALLFGVAYFVVAEAGTFLSVRGSTYVSFWLPAGLYVAVLLLNETRAWPWLVLAAFAGNLAFDLTHGTNPVAALLFCATNAVQSVSGAWLVRRWVAARPRLTTLSEFFGFMGLAAVASSALGAAMGAATLVAFGLSESFVQSWKVWWGSNAMAILLFSPTLLTWQSGAASGHRRRASPERTVEAVALVALSVALTWHLLFVDHGIMAPDKGRMVLPLLWAGLRFGPLGASAANLLVCLPVAFFTTQAFAGLTPAQVASGEYVFVMQTTLAVAALIGLVPATALEELRESEKRLRHLSRQLIEAEEAERRNINRELHDRIGQNLAAINLNLGMLRAGLRGDALAATGPRLDDTQLLLGDTMGHVRDLMGELRPAALDDYGLFAALRNYAAEYSKRFGTQVNVVSDGVIQRLSSSAETALFRIAQEALNNVAKHARATKVDILLAESGGRIVLSVSDDGIGFRLSRAPASGQSWGMTTMRERAEAVGATLAIRSASGRGTRVEASLPKDAA